MKRKTNWRISWTKSKLKNLPSETLKRLSSWRRKLRQHKQSCRPKKKWSKLLRRH